MNFLVDENMPRSLAAQIADLGLGTSAKNMIAKIINLIETRSPASLLGAYTTLEMNRALSRPIRSRGSN